MENESTKITKCPRCGHKKTWEGDDISCPFNGSEIFGDNWNCKHLLLLRKIIKVATSIDDKNFTKVSFCDNTYATINISEIFDDTNEQFNCLYVSWHKDRCSTEAMWLLSQGYPPAKPTYEQLEKIMLYYKSYLK